MPSRPPIEIPKSITRDRATRRLLSTWKNAHDRYRVCRQRVNWSVRHAAKRERSRRREKWKKVATILEMERLLISWLADETRHPYIWSSKNPEAPESRLRFLYRRYYQNRRESHHLTGSARAKKLVRREAIVAEIRSITRMWMVALYTETFPDSHPPKAITLHPTELFPRKVTIAKQWLDKELAA
jgi:hypothetical protein